jgi:rare lipoprotein A
LKHWGVIAAIAALAGATAPAKADEGSVNAALRRHNLSSVVGLSSYYGAAFHGRRTADGERFDMFGLSAANKSLPIPCYARVTNLSNGRSVVVRVNDRGPYIRGRMLDVSERVAHLLHYHGGLERVRLDYLGKAGRADAIEQHALLASLKTGDEPVAVARAEGKPALKTGSDEGFTVAERSAPALAYSGSAPSASAPAAAALAAAVRPMVASAPLSVAAKLDASMRRLETALESAHHAAMDAGRQTAERAARTLSPYGSLVIAPFKALVEASR